MSAAKRGPGGSEPVVVEIEGVAGPATFGRLADALTAVWDALRVLPLGAVQADAFEYFLTRPDAVECTLEFIRRDGLLSLTFAMGGRSYSVRIRPMTARWRRDPVAVAEVGGRVLPTPELPLPESPSASA